ncbi:MAG: hypothetical protein H6719_00310 [Sandaracinaceae bacterium]|nr:hypothetical protein [Sandaracinaceae bacterium]
MPDRPTAASTHSLPRLPPVRIRVVFDSGDHRAALEGYLPELVKAVDDLDDGIVELDPLDLARYALFRRQQNVDGLRNWAELERLLSAEMTTLMSAWSLDDGAIRARNPGPFHLKEDTAAMGVGATLGVVSALLGISEPSWERIPDPPRGTHAFDFRLEDEGPTPTAVHGGQFLELESKGCVGSTDLKTQDKRVDNHRRDVAKKKKSLGSQANLVRRLGAIGVFPEATGVLTEVRLLDPPADWVGRDTERHDLLARLVFYLRVFRTLTGAELLTSLADRIAVLSTIADYRALEGVPLVSRSFSEASALGRGWDRGKTRIRGNVAGKAAQVDDGVYTFVGADFDVLALLRDQDFAALLAYEAEARPAFWWQGRLLVLPPEESGASFPPFPEPRRRRYRRVPVAGFVRIAASGVAFGVFADQDGAEDRLARFGLRCGAGA